MKHNSHQGSVIETIEYIAKQASKMLFRSSGTIFPVQRVVIFPHTTQQYTLFVKQLRTLGDVSETERGARVTMAAPMRFSTLKLEVSGVLQDNITTVSVVDVCMPSEGNAYIGAAIFKYEGDYVWLAETETLASDVLRKVKDEDGDRIELSHPDFDVLGWFFPEQ